MRPSDFDPERWRRIDDVFDAALALAPAARGAYVTAACGADADLRSEVEALLEAHALAEARFREAARVVSDAILLAAGEDPENRRIGPFRLLREIGRGGMGVVYLAEDTRLGRHVALKALPPYLGTGPEAKRRFVSEAKAISALDHPNIATLFDVGETPQGQLYMIFAYYEGETLASRVARGPLPVDEAVDVARGIAAGLAAAHERGIVHRDVKPSNVLLPESGGVKLLDFGVAKVVGEDATGEGVRVGTLAYMSPEQAGGQQVDERTDLWSLGVVLYEMLAGIRPFGHEDPRSLLDSVLHEEPEPLNSLRSDLPESLCSIVDKLLAREREDRYGSAENLLADLHALRAGESASAGIGAPSLSRRSGRAGRLASRARRLLRNQPGYAILAGAVAICAVWLALAMFGAHGRRIERIAVLPLENLTGDSAQQHLVDGVHDALIAELGRVGGLSVISRTSVLRYRGTDLSVPEIARQLQVDAIVEGAVTRQGDSLAVTTDLVAASPEHEVWAGTFRRDVGGVFELADEAARSIADRVEVALTSDEESRLRTARAVDPAAYDAYSLGLFNLERRDPEGFDLARKYFRRSIDIDSGFAPAYAGLAEAYGSAAFFGLLRPAEAMPRVRTLAERALAIDSTLPAGHNMLAGVRLYWDWDWPGAEAEARKAIELNPSYSGAYGILSEVLAVTGRYPEAFAAVERRSELDRLIPFSAFRPAVVLLYMRDFDGAIERARAGLRFFSGFWQGHWLLCLSLEGKGLHAAAIPECERAAARSRRTPMALGALGYTYARSGRVDDAKRVLAELTQRAETNYVGATSIAMLYTGLGDRDRAFQWLDSAYQQHDIALVHLRDQPLWDPLRSDPRFAALLERIGLHGAVSSSAVALPAGIRPVEDDRTLQPEGAGSSSPIADRSSGPAAGSPGEPSGATDELVVLNGPRTRNRGCALVMVPKLVAVRRSIDQKPIGLRLQSGLEVQLNAMLRLPGEAAQLGRFTLDREADEDVRWDGAASSEVALSEQGRAEIRREFLSSESAVGVERER